MGGGHPVDGARKFSVDQDDALVALPHVRQIFLRDIGLMRKGLAEDFEQRCKILVAAPDAEHTNAAIAIERLDDDVLVLPCGRPQARRRRG